MAMISAQPVADWREINLWPEGTGSVSDCEEVFVPLTYCQGDRESSH